MQQAEPEAANIAFELSLELADFRTFYRWVLFHYAKGTTGWYALLASAAAALAVVSIGELVVWGESAFPIVALCVAASVTAYLALVFDRYLRRAPARVVAHVRERLPIHVRLEERCVTLTSAKGRTEQDWSAYTRRADLGTHDVLLVSEFSYLLIPRRDVPAADRERFARLIARVPLAKTFR